MMSLLAFSSSPFSWMKFTAYMLALAAIATFALMPPVSHTPEPAPSAHASPGVPQPAAADLQRIGKPADEVLESLPAIGIPWFLRRAGVTGQVAASDPGQLIITLTWQGKPVGRYTERVQPIDADRTRLYVAFEPDDMALVRSLAAPIDTALDPPGLFRVTLAEQIRSTMAGEGFRLSVLDGATRSRLGAALAAFRGEKNRDTDDFPLSGPDSDAAAIRRAYRDEARRAGPAAPGL